MGKLNIAHHKSYHPYRRDNIERVRQDEEEAKLKEEREEGRMMLAVPPHLRLRSARTHPNAHLGLGSPHPDAEGSCGPVEGPAPKGGGEGGSGVVGAGDRAAATTCCGRTY